MVQTAVLVYQRPTASHVTSANKCLITSSATRHECIVHRAQCTRNSGTAMERDVTARRLRHAITRICMAPYDAMETRRRAMNVKHHDCESALITGHANGFRVAPFCVYCVSWTCLGKGEILSRVWLVAVVRFQLIVITVIPRLTSDPAKECFG